MLRLSFLVLVPLLLALPVRAAVVPERSLSELAKDADLVVHGTVISRESRFDEGARAGRIVTDVSIRVKQAVAGRASAGEVVVLTTPGGEVGRRGQIVPGSPRFETGEEVVVFLHAAVRTSRGDRRPVVSLAQGVFYVARDTVEGPRCRQRLSGTAFLDVGGLVTPAACREYGLDEVFATVRAATANRGTVKP